MQTGSAMYVKNLSRVLSHVVFAVFCLCWTASGTVAAEVINDFSSIVTVHKDGSMRVREEITFTAEGDQIKRGLYRDFPVGYSGPAAYSGRVPFKLVSVELDGTPLNSVETENKGDMLRILMRNDELLSHGEHRFVLTYDTSLHLRFYEGHGELNWNVTGQWAFEILSFSCRIILPEGVPVQKTAAWMGKAGSRASAGIDITKPARNVVLFASDADDGMLSPRLAPNEQFTAAVSFPLGAIADPVVPLAAKQKAEAEEEAEMRAAQEAREAALAKEAAERGFIYETLYYHPMLLPQAGVLCLVFLYFLLAWWRVGKDPVSGPVFARFYPPQARYMGRGSGRLSGYMSPMAVEYVRMTMQSRGRGLAAIFIGLAGRGLCSIHKIDKSTFAVRPKARPRGTPSDLAPEEEIVYQKLTQEASGGELVLSPKQESLRAIFTSAKDSLHNNYGRAWSRNGLVVFLGWFVVLPLALTISFANLDASALTADYPDLPPWFSLFLACLFFCSMAVLPSFLQRLTGRWVVFAIGAVFPLSLVGAMYAEGLFDGMDWILPAVMLIVAYVFSLLMKAPSKQCQQALDEIAGLALYISTAEKNRLEMFNREEASPEDSPEIFKRLLPYALVLGLEKTWCNRFAGQLAEGLLDDSGIDKDLVTNSADWTRFAQGLAGAVAASTAQQSSSSTSSGSAFGGSGGGSGSGSGGGGGGGL